MSIQEQLDSLQPFIIGIRYLKGYPVIDVVLRDGWTLPTEDNIITLKGNDEVNYYMIYSETNGIGVDELLLFVKKTITLNLNREKKQELFHTKVDELKLIFKQNTLDELLKLKFVFDKADDYSVADRYTIDLDETPIETPISEVLTDPDYDVLNQQSQPIIDSQYLDKNGIPIELTEDELELIEEEERGKRNLLVTKAKKKTATIKNISKVELPPKKLTSVPLNERDYEPDCNCGPEEACEKCIENKY
jgi:hypothetical protein